MMERIDRILAHHGYGSRKDVKKLLRTACVTRNGERILDPATRIDPEADALAVDGTPLTLRRDLYLMMHKCADVVCANRDGEHRTVFDLLAPELRRTFFGSALHHVGRLDIDTEGLLILTSDGALTHRLISPKSHIAKTYAVRLRDTPDETARTTYTAQFAQGLRVAPEGNAPAFDAQSATLAWLCDGADIDETTARNAAGCDCLLTLHEGKFHQVKRMFAAVGNEVVYLKRVAVGALKLDAALAPGEYRELTDDELSQLQTES